MQTYAIRRLTATRNIPKPNQYILDLDGEYAKYAFNEERVLNFKGKWRKEVFGVSEDFPVDLEIGTGNGYHFAQRARSFPLRGLVGLEIKYKPLIQTIRRALNNGSLNARVARHHAADLQTVFEKNELNNVFIHFPDPWQKRKQKKNRLIQESFLRELFDLQRHDSFLEFKTDHKEYFEWALEFFANSDYILQQKSFDLHQSEFASQNFVTHFERIFLKKGQPIFYARLLKRS